MRAILLIALLALPGCAQFAGMLPSMQHCNEVNYERRGNQIELNARCTAHIGGGLL